MKIGILEILSLPSQSLFHTGYHLTFSKQYASITPQAISVWCRQLGHQSYYATYYGVGKAETKLPNDLDIVFISCVSQCSLLAYGLAKLYRKAGVRTVIGGPHAKSFPQDCLRFFDYVVTQCDKSLIAGILADEFEKGLSLSSRTAYMEIPSVEERAQEIRASAYFYKRWRNPIFTAISGLSSIGCPYTCNFCTDWNNPYKVLSMDSLVRDMKYISKHMPGATFCFADPNFGVKFDHVVEALESLSPEERVPYMMECSLSLLNPSRIERLERSGCVVGLFGIESWYAYTNKSGVARKNSAREKVAEIVAQFEALKGHIPYLQTHFMFGVDDDRGDEPVELTKEFMRETPYVWPVLNIPTPFGGTPMQEDLLKEGRILTEMPFSLYYTPFLTMLPRHYEVVEYFEKLLELSEFLSSDEMLKQRISSADSLKHKTSHRIRTLGEKGLSRQYKETLSMLRKDSDFRSFHEGNTKRLPDFYRQKSQTLLGKYSELLSEQEIIPNLAYQPPIIV